MMKGCIRKGIHSPIIMKVQGLAAVAAAATFILLTTQVSAAKKYCLPTESCWPLKVTIELFKNELNATGAKVLTKDDDEWPGKNLTFNQAVAKTPGLVVYLGNVDQIRKALQFADKHNIKVSIVSSGHSFLGRCGDEGAMQISVHYMKGIKVDLNCTANALGCITTQAGVQWGEAYREAGKYGRIVVGGSNPTVSVSGWTLGGGHSPLSRSFGLGVDNVVMFHLVAADYSEVWATETGVTISHLNGSVTNSTDNSLFYALRGGGSAFGVIVDMTFKMHKDDIISQLNCFYPAFQDGTAKTFEVQYKTIGEYILGAPNTFSGYLLSSVGCSPQGCGGTSFISILHYGPIDDPVDAKWLQKFTDLPHKWTAQGLTGGGCSISQFDSFYDYEMTVQNSTYTSQYLGGSLIQEDLLSNAMVDTIAKHHTRAYERAKVDASENLFMTAIWVGGAVKIPAVGVVPIHEGWRNAIFTLSSSTAWDPKNTPDPTKRITRVKDFHKDLARYSNGKYYNEAEDDMSPAQWKREFWGDDIYNKLMGIKKAWDPENKFTCHQCLGSDWDPAKDASNRGVFGRR